ncbi:hypothetical protein BC830DRAFT_1151228 [Chytriomyces sp. MP71]|nr:hypothetical protein BC830DRAFT_1151228 [Chytriomyces sp. MP71]
MSVGCLKSLRRLRAIEEWYKDRKMTPKPSPASVHASNCAILKRHHTVHAVLALLVLVYRTILSSRRFPSIAIAGYVLCNGIIFFMFLWMRNMASVIVNRQTGEVVDVGADLRAPSFHAFDVVYVFWTILLLSCVISRAWWLLAVFPIYGLYKVHEMMRLFMFDGSHKAGSKLATPAAAEKNEREKSA